MPTNVVFIITDNQGAWTLGCYGNREIRTPHIDRMSACGVRFSRATCVNPVCSPNRATCLTGLMPSQHGVHCWLGTEQPDAQMGSHAYCTIEEFDTIPRILSDRGYRCGLAGKWHLGDSLHPRLGFSDWFTMPHGHTRTFYDAEAIRQGKVYREPRYFTDAITGHATDFLRKTRGDPFFLYVGYNGPYGLDEDLRAGHRNRHSAAYADQEMECFPRNPIHPWLRGNRDVINNVAAMRSYAAAVSGVDDGVGTILDTLECLGLADDTLVVFTADQGFYGGHHGLWGMADHARPLPVFDENLLIPLILRHPGSIPPGHVSSAATCNYDFFPTLLDYLDLPTPSGDGLERPGRSYAAHARGASDTELHEATFHEFENTRTIRTDRWKCTRRHPDGPHELYDIVNDSGEARNRIDDPECATVKTDLAERLDAFFDRYSQPRHDLWREGSSKAGRVFG